MKPVKLFYAFLITLLITGCNLPVGSRQTPEADRVATEVSLMLTKLPSATAAPNTAAPTTAAPTSASTAAPTITLPAATATTAPTVALAIPTPTVTVPAGDPKSALGAPTWRNTLDDAKLFYLYENDNTRVTHQDGGLLLTGITANGWMGWSLTYSKPSQNFYLEAVLNPQTCSGSDVYGLVFRAPNSDSGYFYGVTCDGKYNLRARNFADGSNIGLIESTANSAVQSGSNVVNRLGVMASGNRIGLYANGVLLQEINDANFTKEGYFGAFVAANQTPGFTVKLDEIAIWVLPGDA